LAPALTIGHLSDLHVSPFGDTFHRVREIVRRSLVPAAPRGPLVWEQAGWSVYRDGKGAQLLDPQGYEHKIPSKWRTGEPDPVLRARTRAELLAPRHLGALTRSEPSTAELDLLLREHDHCTNLRFARHAAALPRDLDFLCLTGDITDDGEGYELVESRLAHWIRAGRLLAVPGNHDAFQFPLKSSSRPLPDRARKRSAFAAFAKRIGLELFADGSWFHPVPERSVVFAGLSSVARQQATFLRHNGSIGAVQLARLRRMAQSAEWQGARHRVVLFHHHLTRMGRSVGRVTREVGMRLDDAEKVAQTLNQIGATLVLHGHRHISETRRPAGCHFDVVSAPSFTLGCASGAGPSYWRIELGERSHFERVPVP
jgi:3',5'-cyclic-AMP phosphodiesterase